MTQSSEHSTALLHRNLLYGAGISLAICIVATIFRSLQEIPLGDYGMIITLSGMASKWLCISLLIRYGTVLKGKFRGVFLVLLGISLIGALFKIQHWPFSGTMLIAGSAGLMVVYVLHFLNKRSKNLLDILKLSWVILAVLDTILLLTHTWPMDQFKFYFEGYFLPLLFYGMVIYFVTTVVWPDLKSKKVI